MLAAEILRYSLAHVSVLSLVRYLFSLYVVSFFTVGNYLFVFFFFFQAEDGIRDVAVTGVQTCALPIFAFGHVEHVVGQFPPLLLRLTFDLGPLAGNDVLVHAFTSTTYAAGNAATRAWQRTPLITVKKSLQSRCPASRHAQSRTGRQGDPFCDSLGGAARKATNAVQRWLSRRLRRCPRRRLRPLRRLSARPGQ